MANGNPLNFPDFTTAKPQTPLADGGGPPHDGRMESRLTALETRLDTIVPTLATREDMHKIDASIKTWMIATIIALFLGFAGLFFTLSNSLKPAAQPAQSTAPTIIQVPAYVQPPSHPVEAPPIQPEEKAR